MSRPPCGTLKTRNNNAYTREELIKMYKLTEKGKDKSTYRLKTMKVIDFCKELGMEEEIPISAYQRASKRSKTNSSKEKVCAMRATKKYDTYKKPELIDMYQRKYPHLTKKSIRTIPIKTLCAEFPHIKNMFNPKSPPKNVRPSPSPKNVGSSSSPKNVRTSLTLSPSTPSPSTPSPSKNVRTSLTLSPSTPSPSKNVGSSSPKNVRSSSSSPDKNVEYSPYCKKESLDCMIPRNSEIKLKPHQRKVVEWMNDPSHRGLLVIHPVGSGKTLTAVTSSQCFLKTYPEQKVIVATPVSLQDNFKKELRKYGVSEKEMDRDYQFFTHESFLTKNVPCEGNLLIVDEAHNLRTHIKTSKKTGELSEGKVSQKILHCSQLAKKVLLLSATPVVNDVSDIANMIAMINGVDVNKALEKMTASTYRGLENYFSCLVSFYEPSKEELRNYPSQEHIYKKVVMDDDYLEKYMQIENNLKFESDKDLQSFYNGVRRASNTIDKLSPKIDAIYETILDEIRNAPKQYPARIVVFSNFISSGLNVLKEKLERATITYQTIQGDLSKEKRTQAVNAYNNGDATVLLISSAGSEGLDLKKTTALIITEPAWNETLMKQVAGRAIRDGSHKDLPEHLRHVRVYHFLLIKPTEDEMFEEILQDNIMKPKMSVDLYLNSFSKDKQDDLDTFMVWLERHASIEISKKCGGIGVSDASPPPKMSQKTRKAKSSGKEKRADKAERLQNTTVEELFEDLFEMGKTLVQYHVLASEFKAWRKYHKEYTLPAIRQFINESSYPDEIKSIFLFDVVDHEGIHKKYRKNSSYPLDIEKVKELLAEKRTLELLSLIKLWKYITSMYGYKTLETFFNEKIGRGETRQLMELMFPFGNNEDQSGFFGANLGGDYARQFFGGNNSARPPQSSESPGKKCRELLARYGITDKKTFYKWSLVNHPDRKSGELNQRLAMNQINQDEYNTEMRKLGEQIQWVNSCMDTLGWK